MDRVALRVRVGIVRDGLHQIRRRVQSDDRAVKANGLGACHRGKEVGVDGDLELEVDEPTRDGRVHTQGNTRARLLELHAVELAEVNIARLRLKVGRNVLVLSNHREGAGREGGTVRRAGRIDRDHDALMMVLQQLERADRIGGDDRRSVREEIQQLGDANPVERARIVVSRAVRVRDRNRARRSGVANQAERRLAVEAQRE